MIPQNYIESFSFDYRLAPYDIQGSIAHVKMLAKQLIIPQPDAKKIIQGLNSILNDIHRGKQIPAAEDIHFAIENELVKRIGNVGKKMHTARSRNDQVALDLKLYTREWTQKIIQAIQSAQQSILNCAIKNKTTLMPGFTHLQHGQPIFFAHHILAYAWMIQRDKERFEDSLKRTNISPMGACALAGTSFPIDRKYTAELLEFNAVSENSIDTVSDRDFIIEFVFNCALTMTHLSRLAEELIIWSSSEFDYVKLANEFTSGSSIMPQKRNPDTAELIRGKCSRTFGALMHLLSLMKNQPLAYNRDMQEDKPPLFDSAETTFITIELVEQIFKSIETHPKKMEAACSKGFLLATELADYLARKGMPFREAHGIIGEIAEQIRAGYLNENTLTLNQLKKFSMSFNNDVLSILSPYKAAENRNSYGGTGQTALTHQIKKLQSIIKKKA